MGSLKELITGDPLHGRSIDMKTYALDEDTIQKVIGLEISAGFQKKVRELMGGEKGCAHLTHLLTVMSQAAFQGYVAHKRRDQRPVPRSLEDVEGLEYLLGSCRAWRADGPKVVNLKAAIER